MKSPLFTEFTEQDFNELTEMSRLCRGDILKMTTLAGCGHPGGSMSAIDILLTLYKFANLSKDNFDDIGRDRVVVSNGHISPAVYAGLGRFKFFDVDESIAYFRLKGSIFEGHVERDVPGVEWTTGNLGQGLSAGCGFALGSKLLNINSNVFVLMGDGEQQKGQISEARRFANKFALSNLTALIDYNKLQISGCIKDVMPQDIKGNYTSDGWDVIDINGHDFKEIFDALKYAVTTPKPVAIIANTVMGKGVSFMENREKYHGQAISEDELSKALEELGIKNDINRYKIMRSQPHLKKYREIVTPKFTLKLNNRFYSKDKSLDNRSAYGNALKDIAESNSNVTFAVFDCDLSGSVKTDAFAKIRGDQFFQSGIQEHNTAVVAGAISTLPIISVFSDFGMFGVDEVYNQMRLNDINMSNLKLICTHIGLNVGEDGKTHHCIDYIGLIGNLFNFKVIIPSDPNQTDKAVKYILSTSGNFFVGMGRSKAPIVLDSEGKEYYNENYKFIYGKADKIRDGRDVAIITMGPIVEEAIKASELLKKEGIEVAVINISSPLDIDIQMLKESAKCKLIITAEDHNVNTGLGSRVANAMIDNDIRCRFVKLGVRGYTTSGKTSALYSINGIDADGIIKCVKDNLNI